MPYLLRRKDSLQLKSTYEFLKVEFLIVREPNADAIVAPSIEE